MSNLLSLNCMSSVVLILNSLEMIIAVIVEYWGVVIYLYLHVAYMNAMHNMFVVLPYSYL